MNALRLEYSRHLLRAFRGNFEPLSFRNFVRAAAYDIMRFGPSEVVRHG